MAHDLTPPGDDYIPRELMGVTHLTPEDFAQVSRKYSELRFELTSERELIVIPPASVETARQNANLTNQLKAWTRQDATGVWFGSTAAFTLPNNAIRSPHASWIRRDRWESLGQRQGERFAPICPDFVAELRLPTDMFPEFGKMAEYAANGASLGWLIDRTLRRVYIYRPNEAVETLENAETISGEPLLPGFTLNLVELWNDADLRSSEKIRG